MFEGVILNGELLKVFIDYVKSFELVGWFVFVVEVKLEYWLLVFLVVVCNILEELVFFLGMFLGGFRYS